jgi:hypothetical protein
MTQSPRTIGKFARSQGFGSINISEIESCCPAGLGGHFPQQFRVAINNRTELSSNGWRLTVLNAHSPRCGAKALDQEIVKSNVM